MDPTCEKLNEKQRQEMMLVNKDNTVGLIVKNNFAPKRDRKSTRLNSSH